MKSSQPGQRAFVLRIAPGKVDRVQQALDADQLIIGWSNAEGLLDPALSWSDFRSRLRATYYEHDKSGHRAGSAAGNMWRFIREMHAGDLVVVPWHSKFFVARVTGAAVYLPDERASDTAYRRPVEWLNGKQGIPRRVARAALQSRLKTQTSCVDATDLIAEISEYADWGCEVQPTFEADVVKGLTAKLLKEIRTGRIENYGFENLLSSVFRGLGAKEVRIVPRQSDKGADLIATFQIAGTFDIKVAVQAKHFQPKPPIRADVINKLAQGMEAEEADLGIVATSGTFSPEAEDRATRLREDEGLRIELLDGEQLAAIIIENGLVRSLEVGRTR